MPVLLPADIGADRFCSQGERDVFEYLRRSSMDGYVIHSLGFDMRKQHEIDYVVICERGILCLEVKGGGVERKDNEWFYVDHEGRRHPGGAGPYRQALDNMYALRGRFREHFRSGDISHTQFAYGVIFPDAPFNFKGVDVVRDLTFDKTRSLDDFDKFVMDCYDHSERQCLNQIGVAGTRLKYKKDQEMVKDYLVGDFGYIPDLNDQLDGIERRLNVTTEEQFTLLRSLQKNRRLIVSGGAGTGKTMIAVEHAKRLSDQGNRVLFLSFNKLIKNYLSRTQACENITYDNIDNFLYRAVHEEGGYQVPEDGMSGFFGHQLPEEFIGQDGIPEEERFDCLVVDEAQDILCDDRVLCLDLMVKGGLGKGRVAIFYDEMQNIFNPGMSKDLDDNVDSLLESYGFASFELTKNCRSTRRIVDFLNAASGISAVAESEIDGLPITIIPYENTEGQRDLLAKTIKRLIKDNVPPEDIVVISHMGEKNQNGCFYDLSALKGVCSYRFLDSDRSYEKVPNVLQLTTVQRFKGLEAKVVIVADVYKLYDDDKKPQMRNYTAFSRAKTHLYVLAHSAIKNELSKIVRNVG